MKILKGKNILYVDYNFVDDQNVKIYVHICISKRVVIWRDVSEKGKNFLETKSLENIVEENFKIN